MRYGFFDAQITGYDANGLPTFDRAEDSAFFSSFFEAFLTDGIYTAPADGFAVRAAEGMTLSVAPGRCLIRGRFGWAEKEETLTLAAADSNRGRIDRVVLRLDLIARTVSTAVVSGEYAAAGYTAPALTRDLTLGVWELALADIDIPAASVEITGERITDLRGDKLLCGFVTSVGTLEAGAAAVAIAPEDWEGTEAPYEVTKPVAGVTASGHIVVSGSDDSMALWLESGCYAAAQGDGTVTFKALYALPAGTVTANILIVG